MARQVADPAGAAPHECRVFPPVLPLLASAVLLSSETVVRLVATAAAMTTARCLRMVTPCLVCGRRREVASGDRRSNLSGRYPCVGQVLVRVCSSSAAATGGHDVGMQLPV